jgi:isocitrate dehydrogenase
MASDKIRVPDNGSAIGVNDDFSLEVPNNSIIPFIEGDGIAPWANLSDGIMMFEATQGTAPKLAVKNMANPLSHILSAEMLLGHIGRPEAENLIVSGASHAIANAHVTCDLAEMVGVEPLSCSDYAAAVIQQM